MQSAKTVEKSSDNYKSKTAKSREIFEQAKKVLPAGVTYAIRYFEPYPFIAARGKGSKVWDVDGNEYTDYWIGHGALIMGHAYPPVVEAAKAQIELGSHLGYSNEWEVKFATQVVKMVPSAEMIRPTNSGTEANIYATRVARAFTGRKKVAKFEGNWHGGSDALHKGTGYPFEERASAGLDEELQSNTLVMPYNDLEGVERKIKGQEKDIACFLLEPLIGGGGCIPPDMEFLRGMKELASRVGALLIFDEVITGFRLAPGGAQEFYGVVPDLTVMGKIVGGGAFPAGCFCGPEYIMERIDHVRFPNPSQRSFHGGTYTGNALTARAGYTLLSDLDRMRDTIYPRLLHFGRKAREEITKIFERNNFEAFVTGEGPLFAIHFTKVKPHDVRSANETKNKELTAEFFRFVLGKNIAYLSPSTAHFFVSAVHSDQEIENLIVATEEFVKTKK